MENEEVKTKYPKDRRGIWTGILLIIIGGFLLAKQIGAPLPAWIFNWHVLLIAFGLYIGLRHNFRHPIWVIIVLIGGFLTAEDFYPTISIHQYGWPLAIIGVGLIIIFRPRHRNRKIWWEQWEEQHKNVKWEEHINMRREQRAKYKEYTTDYTSGEDYLDVVSVLGGVKKNILSKNFKGGEAVSLLGGTELNLSQADINGRVVLDLTQVLGGTKLIIPPHWDLRTELSVSVLGSIDDKRSLENVVIDPNKVLVLKGVSVFGGIDIRSY
ncbi:MAG TPA: hypothetical protein VK705_00420 [Ferruginibacter sp.]|jgi:hypothetical protein|nr:hypothetical protein [Ferruginibacter sp.]